jgi:tRNA pseudouridine55 synthase
MDGVLVVDKPEGLTSHDVVAVARRALHETRIGHTGTLDPMATGVLPLAIGRATRLVRFLTASDKEYDATIRFGLTTDSYDITGRETSRSGRQPDREALGAALASLTGEYLQTPPAFSAKKVGGTRAYALARRGRVPPTGAADGERAIQLAPVPVNVSRAELESFEGALARVTLTCSAGFYVRAFAHALGERVGTGACLSALRRTRSGDFTLDYAVTIGFLQPDSAAADRLVPLERVLAGFPAVHLTAEGRSRVAHGRDVEAAQVAPGSGMAQGDHRPWVRLLDADGRLVAIGTPGPGPGSLHPAVVLI